MHLLGLRGVSQVWSSQPAWYFWIQRAAGPYHLRLESARDLVASSRSIGHAGLFSLRCYPLPDIQTGAVFTEQERTLVSGDCFDETNTPKFEYLDDIPLHLFQVAAVEYTVGPNEAWELVAVENMRRASLPVATHTCEHCGRSALPHDGTNGLALHPDVTFPFLDMFISLLTHRTRHKPLRVALQATSLPEDTVHEPSESHAHHGKDPGLLTTFVLLGSPGEDAYREGDSLLDEELRRDHSTVLLDERFPHGRFRHVHGPSHSSPLPNERWWTLAEEEFPSLLSSICGCKDCS